MGKSQARRSRLARHLSYANVVATMGLFFALGGTAVAAVMITSNSQVAQNTISGHAAPSGKHANLVSGSINASDLNSSVKSTFTDHCPSGMFFSGGRDLCFDPNERGFTTFTAAMTACGNLGRRLPDVGELVEVLNSIGATADQEWTSDLDSQFDAMLLAQNDNRQIMLVAAPVGNDNTYRCVSTPTN